MFLVRLALLLIMLGFKARQGERGAQWGGGDRLALQGMLRGPLFPVLRFC